jgi:hypothetical protein
LSLASPLVSGLRAPVTGRAIKTRVASPGATALHIRTHIEASSKHFVIAINVSRLDVPQSTPSEWRNVGLML